MEKNIHYHIYPFLKLIPKNKLTSYKTLGEIFGLHPRTIAKILEKNTEIEKYPCYKVIYSNGDIGGYNKGLQEKIKKLENDGFVIEKKFVKNTRNIGRKINTATYKVKYFLNTSSKNSNSQLLSSLFWKPRLSNFFIAFPLEGKDLEKFKELSKYLAQINNGSFNIQKANSPHITLRFFGKLNLKTFHKIVKNTLKITKKIKTSLINQTIKLNQFDNFNERIYFYKPKSENIEKEFKKFYIQFHKLMGISKEIRPYRTHLTIARIKNKEEFEKIRQKFFKICDKFNFDIKITKLRFYAAIDGQFQIPLIDINLNTKKDLL